MNRCALYARVSTDEQAERYGLTSQLHELRALAARKGYQVVAECLDDGYSGATLERPALTRMRDAARAGAVDVVLAHDTDRLSRSLVHQLLLLEELERARVRVEFLSVSADATPEGTMLLQVKGVIAEYERAKIRERTARGRREKARRGLFVAGAPPYGYRPDPATRGRLIVHEAEAAVVRMIFRWLVEEQRSARSVVLELRRLGVPSARAGRWGKSSVQRLLANRTYMGEAHFNRREVVVSPRSGRKTRHVVRPREQWIPVSVPAIVTPEAFAAAQAQLARNRAVLVGRPTPFLYLLRGLLRCGACGGRYHGNPSHGQRYYRCSGRDRLAGRGCGVSWQRAEPLEAVVWETIAGALRQPAVLMAGLEGRHARLGAREVEIRSAVEHLAVQLAGLARQEQRLLDLYVTADEAQAALVVGRLEALRVRRAGLREQLARAEAQAAAQGAAEGQQAAVARWCALAVRRLAALDASGRQRLLAAVVDEITLRGRVLEIRGVLPALESTPTAAQCGPYPGAAYTVVVPVGGRP